jgi:hypothetical protein
MIFLHSASDRVQHKWLPKAVVPPQCKLRLCTEVGQTACTACPSRCTGP